jgi:cytochrome c-type protein NapB
MNQQKMWMLVATGLLIQSSLYAMDMDRVNALASQFSGKSVTTTHVETVAPVKETTAPVVKVEELKKEVATVVTQSSPEPKVEAVTATVTEESLGLRKTNLYAEEAETAGEATTYGKDAAGSSKKFDRAFENAPPMIPHDVEGMLPIKVGNNACTGCHLPDVAPSMKATPVPPSHFASFRPATGMTADGKISKEGKGVDNTSDFKTVVHKLDKLSGARFNCSQCHAPQSTQAPLVGNTFTPDFSENGSKRSNLIDTINEGVEGAKSTSATEAVVAPVVVAAIATPTLEKVVESEPKVEAVKATVTEESLGLRKTNLYVEEAETTGEATSYGKAAAGSSKRFARAFENAPPMIPHDVDGMLPIKIGNNACTGCHLPDVAPSMKATPIPKSHFASFRPTTAIAADGKISKEGKSVDNTSDFKTVAHKLDKLSGARFNCSQCHAPQSTQAPLVGNTFTPDFSENGSTKSNLIDTINIGVQ